MNIDALIRDEAWAAGIPSSLVGSVVARFHAARRAVEDISRWRRGRDRAGPPVRVLVERIVKSAAADHRLGVLERRCEG